MNEPKDQKQGPPSPGDPQHVAQDRAEPAPAVKGTDEAAQSAAAGSPEAPEGPRPPAQESVPTDAPQVPPEAAKPAAEPAVPSVTSPATAWVEVPAISALPPGTVRAAYEHPWAVRFCHWLNAVSIFVMVLSGLQILDAFPNFGPKIPQKTFINVPEAAKLGGWLAGGLQWHFTFMWIFVGTGLVYLGYEFASGHYKTVLFTPKDIPGVWPMIRHYFLFGPEPPVTEQYNALQKLAYTVTVLCGVASVLTGIVIYKPIQFWWLAGLMGGFHLARMWHFAAMCGFLAFIPGHLLMVALHGWNNFVSMLTGWKKNPEYL
jgi:Ni/Fe-hydrogenase b-type cytochrome subunit